MSFNHERRKCNENRHRSALNCEAECTAAKELDARCGFVVVALRVGEGGGVVIARCSGGRLFPENCPISPCPESLICLEHALSRPPSLVSPPQTHVRRLVAPLPLRPLSRSSVKLSECSLTARETSNVLRREGRRAGAGNVHSRNGENRADLLTGLQESNAPL